MRTLLSIFLILIAIVSSGQDTLQSGRMKGLESFVDARFGKYKGQKLPDFAIIKTGELIFSNKNFEKKVVFINFWFAACKPCISEIEGLNKMYNLLKDKPDFTFISFTFDPEETISSLIKKYNIQYRVIHLDRNECNRLNFNSGYPTNIILSKDGNIKFFMAGGTSLSESTYMVLNLFYPKILSQF